MAIINESRVLDYGLAKGIDTTSQPGNTPEGFVKVAKNANLGVNAGYEKRDGVLEQLSSAWDTNRIIGGIEFKQTDLDSKIILFNAAGKLAVLTSGVPVNLQTGLLADTKPTMLAFEERLFFFNGDDTNSPFVYDAQLGVRVIGIAAPTVAPTKDADIAGGLNTGGTDEYIYVYTYYNSETEAESSPSPDIKGVLAPSGGVELGITPGDSATADKIRIYRTVASGTTLILEGEEDIAATSFDSVIPDDELGVAFNNRLLEFDNSLISDLTDSAKFSIVADNRIFVVTGTNEARFSKIGQSGPMPESFQANGLVETESRYGASDPLVGQGQIKDRVIALKKRSIGFYEPVGVAGVNEAVDTVQYIYREITDVTGAISHFGGGQVFDEFVFLGRDNVYATNGITVRPVGNQIQNTVRAMGFAEDEINRYSFVNDTKNKRIYISGFKSSGEPDSQPDFQLVGDYQQYPEFRWTTYEPGDDPETHPGFNVGAFFTIQDPTTGSLEVYFGDSREIGQYQRMNVGQSDNGDGIFFEVLSRGYHHGQPMADKLFKDIEILGKAANKQYNLEVCYHLDFVPKDEGCFECFLPVAGGSWEDTSPEVFNWANEDVELDDSQTLQWAGEQVAIVTFDAHRKAQFLQVLFRQSEPEAPITLISWGSVASIYKRK